MTIKQAVAIGLSVVLIAVLVGSGVVLASAVSRTREVARSRDDARASLERIYGERIFPSAPNVAVIKRQTLDLTAWTNRFIETQRAAFRRETRLTPSQFMQTLQPAIRELAKGQTTGGTRIVADGFAFGFDAYLTGGQMPVAEDVPKLALQLEMTQRICRELFAANIVSLQKMQRFVFETEAKRAPPPPAEETGGLRRNRARPAAAAAPGATAVNPRALDGPHPFTLEFTARRDALLAVLNRLAAAELFVVVTDLDVRKTGPDVRTPPEKWRELGAAPHAQRVVSGPEVDPLLLVRIVLAVETF